MPTNTAIDGMETPPLNPDTLRNSSLYSEELAPVPASARTWNHWHLAALWVGMAVCIPTWLLASYMLKAGLNWIEALLIIGLANLVITVPMVLNGYAGVKYGLSFPVIGRAAFGLHGIHVASMLRALVACGWFGVQTWVGGLAIGAMLSLLLGEPYQEGTTLLNFIGFGLFWLISMFFVVKGFEGIKWLEEYSAPLLIAVGIALIAWGVAAGGGFGAVLEQSQQLQTASAHRELQNEQDLVFFHPLTNAQGEWKPDVVKVRSSSGGEAAEVFELPRSYGNKPFFTSALGADHTQDTLEVWYETRDAQGKLLHASRPQRLNPAKAEAAGGTGWWDYLLWFTAMVGFWATMAISISDITRYAKNQRAQVSGQFLGLPATMMLFSFVGLFVTSAAALAFADVLTQEDAPWDPASLLSHFNQPLVVIGTQLVLLVATLSTNLAANVIAPATAFSNMWPKRISFRTGGLLTGLIGIAICPWWLLNEISSILLLVSAFLGPVLGILLADYFWVRKQQLDVPGLFSESGPYRYNSMGINPVALIALLLGIGLALVGAWIEALSFLYQIAWFTGFIVAFLAYGFGMKKASTSKTTEA